MAKHDDPEAQKAWENLYRLIRLVPDPEGWDIRGKLEVEAEAYGKAMYGWGREGGFEEGVHVGQESRD